MTEDFKEKILIAGCIVIFASIILLEYPNFRISMNIKDAVTTYTAFMPIGLFLLYLLRTIPKRLFLLRKKFFKVYGTVLDSFPAGKSWFPVIQYRTQENKEIVFIPDGVLMFQPKNGSQISIHVLKEDHTVAESFRPGMVFFTILIVNAVWMTGLGITFWYTVFSNAATESSRITILCFTAVCVLCCIFLNRIRRIIAVLFSLKTAQIVKFRPGKNKDRIITRYLAMARLQDYPDTPLIKLGRSTPADIGSTVLVRYNSITGKYKQVHLAFWYMLAAALFCFAVLCIAI